MVFFIIKRIFSVIPKAFTVVTLIFFIIRLGPGDPTEVILGDHASAEAVRILREQLGLDRPILNQYWDFLKGLIRLDLGNSYINNQPVIGQLKNALPYSLELTLGGILFGAILGIPMGIIAAARKNKFPDYLCRVLSAIGISFPAFLTGTILLVFFSVKLEWFPAMGVGDYSNPIKHLHHLILPSFSLGIIILAFVARMVRSSILEILNQDYIRTARGKGLSERNILFQHALKNALIPIITIIGLYSIISMVSAILIELVFSRPGLGTLIIGAIKQSDFPTIQAALLTFAFFVIFVNLAVDICYYVFDPRIRLK